MLQNDVKYRTAMKASYFSTWPKSQFTEKTLIFSKTVD